MSKQLSNDPSLKEINAYKKQLNWGEVPAIYHMASSTVGDLDGILSHGFDSAYKQILDKNNWNLAFLDGHKDQLGNITVNNKPQIYLRHVFQNGHYELHCLPQSEDNLVSELLNKPSTGPFLEWRPESMQMLFRLSNFVNFMVYCVQSGDEADLALVKFAYKKVEYLIAHLAESFDILKVKGRNLAEVYKQLCQHCADDPLLDLATLLQARPPE